MIELYCFYKCNLERLKLWESDQHNMTGSTKLGINVFKSINKGVDALHIKNHVSEKCKTYYPEVKKFQAFKH